MPERIYNSHYGNAWAMGCRQCLPLSVVQLKGKHCRKPRYCNGVVDTFGHSQFTVPLYFWLILFLSGGGGMQIIPTTQIFPTKIFDIPAPLLVILVASGDLHHSLPVLPD